MGALIVWRTSGADWAEGSGDGLLDEEPMPDNYRGQLSVWRDGGECG